VSLAISLPPARRPPPLLRVRSNSINDLAATITIAKEGYPTMAVAGAYAGPMFNVLAGECVQEWGWLTGWGSAARGCRRTWLQGRHRLTACAANSTAPHAPPPAAGIGLPMVIYTMKDPSQQYVIGKDTPLVWASFITLLVSLTVTLVWVPFEGAY
jgi:hypothetical protein